MLLRDLRYGFRRLRRSPGFAIVAILTLALGIGANTAIFSTVNALLLRPYPFPNLNRLMLVRQSDPNRPGDEGIAPADYLDFRTQATSFSDLAAFRFGTFNLTDENGPGAIEGYMVTPDLFQMIGAVPLQGRVLGADEAEPGKDQVAVISHNTWTERFAGDPAIVGKSIRLNSRNVTIVGVMPRGFHYPLGSEIWVPLVLKGAGKTDRANHNLGLLGLTKPGTSRRQAEAELEAISRRLQQQYPGTDLHRTANILPLREEQYAYTAPMFLMLQAAAVFVLLLACANLLNLLLAQAVSRRREVAVRSALGADRLHLVRLFATESLLLALLAVAVAIGVSVLGISAVRNAMPSGMTKWIAGWSSIQLDIRVLGLAVGLAILVAFVIGLTSTLRASRVDANAGLKGSSVASTGDRAQNRVLGALVVTQVVLAVVLLVGALSTVRSFFSLANLYRGFGPENLLLLELRLPQQTYSDAIKSTTFYQKALQQAHSLPQLESAALASNTPASNVDNELVAFDIQGRNSLTTTEAATADLQVISPEFFPALRVPLMQGRLFSDADGSGATPVAIISQSMATRHWPNSSPLGQSIRLKTGSNAVTVVGVVSDIKLNWTDPRPRPTIYLPYPQASRNSLTLVARTKPGQQDAARPLRERLQQLDPEIAMSEMRPLTREVSDSLAPVRIIGWLMFIFGGVAFALSTIGIYGMLSHRVARQGREFGLRVALGATSEDLFRQVVVQAIKLAGTGLVLGLPIASGLNYVAAHQLFGLDGLRWPILAIFSVALLLVAIAAALVPARRAMRSDPMIALRCE